MEVDEFGDRFGDDAGLLEDLTNGRGFRLFARDPPVPWADITRRDFVWRVVFAATSALFLRFDQRDVPDPGNLVKHDAASGDFPCHWAHGSAFPELRRFFLDVLPRPFHMTGLRVGLTDAEAQRKFSIEPGMSQKEVATRVEALHE